MLMRRTSTQLGPTSPVRSIHICEHPGIPDVAKFFAEPLVQDNRFERAETFALASRGVLTSEPEDPLVSTTRFWRIDDIVQKKEWRIIYYVGNVAIAVLDVVAKDTRTTPVDVIKNCKRRLAAFKSRDEP